MYASITKIPYPYRQGNGSMMKFTMESAFWIFNMVSNYAYTRYCDMYPEIAQVQSNLHNEFVEGIKTNDSKFAEMAKTSPEKVIVELNNYSDYAANKTHKTWTELYAHLFTKYMDGNVKTDVEVPAGYIYHAPSVSQPPLKEEWYRRIAAETGDKLKLIGPGH